MGSKTVHITDPSCRETPTVHYSDVIMGVVASQITSLTTVYSTVYSDADQRKHQGSASLSFVRGIQRGPVNSPHKWPVTRKMFPFDDVIMMLICRETPAVNLNTNWTYILWCNAALFGPTFILISGVCKKFLSNYLRMMPFKQAAGVWLWLNGGLGK